MLTFYVIILTTRQCMSHNTKGYFMLHLVPFSNYFTLKNIKQTTSQPGYHTKSDGMTRQTTVQFMLVKQPFAWDKCALACVMHQLRTDRQNFKVTGFTAIIDNVNVM